MNEDVNSLAVDGVSRRTMLKKGALVGATVAWTVPLISVVSMTPAHAESPSGAGHGGGSGTSPVKQGSSNTGGGSTNLGGSTANTGALASTGSDVSATAAIGVAAAVLGAGAIVASKYRGDRTDGDVAE